VAALGALALGGAAFAQAQSSSTPPPEKASAVDRDTVQSGDQTTPDTTTAKTTRFTAVTAAPSDPAGGSNAQGPDTGTTPETPGAENPETGAGSETGPSDGPGGHADPAGAAGADHQFQGNE
jgi:hypothetical protein